MFEVSDTTSWVVMVEGEKKGSMDKIDSGGGDEADGCGSFSLATFQTKILYEHTAGGDYLPTALTS